MAETLQDLYTYAVENAAQFLDVNVFIDYLESGYLEVDEINHTWIDARITPKLDKLYSGTLSSKNTERRTSLYAFGEQTINEAYELPEGTPILDGKKILALRKLDSGDYLACMDDGGSKIVSSDTVTLHRLNSHTISVLLCDVSREQMAQIRRCGIPPVSVYPKSIEAQGTANNTESKEVNE